VVVVIDTSSGGQAGVRRLPSVAEVAALAVLAVQRLGDIEGAGHAASVHGSW
jgi:hypothetical protein